MKAEIEQELAHVLLIELLAHQFTFPVKWIETQDVLLMEQEVERLVEIGPTPTLTNMAKRTMENLYDGLDPKIRHREFLSATKDADKVYYRVQPVAQQADVCISVEQCTNLEHILPSKLEPISRGTPATSTTVDLDLTAGYVLRTILATKFKRTAAEIDTSSTIKQLAGGRSTVENEIVGDLIAEFKNLPDRAEEQCIRALGESLETGFSGSLGLYSSSQLSRLCSTRMPGGFSVEAAREYLNITWGLAKGRQSMVLLHALTCLPSARLRTFEDAESFFDDIVNEHSIETATPMRKTSQKSSAVKATFVDRLILDNIDHMRKRLSEKQMQIFAQDLGHDLRTGDRKAAATQNALEEALGELDLWNAEHGFAYVAGIKPLVQMAKARTYQSWLQWAEQNATYLFHQIMNAELLHDEQAMAVRLLHISNCASPRLLKHLRSLTAEAKELVVAADDSRVTTLESLCSMCDRSISKPPVYRSTYHNLMPVTSITAKGETVFREVPRASFPGLRNALMNLGKDTPVATEFHQSINLEFPNITVKVSSSTVWRTDEHITAAYLRSIQHLDDHGDSFTGKNVLLTGAGPNSIGLEILKGLLAGGAQVLCTTSRFSTETADAFQEIYSFHAGRGSRLIILPFNQASMQDVESLVSYIYDNDGLQWDLDLIIPFAAISEEDRDISQIDAKSELAHRAMLTNTVRLLGSVIRRKQARGITTRPAQVILPLSSNHGMIGRDGLYAESKLALEGLLHKWHSEEWSSYLSLCGTEIGWTRGTGLMNSNDIVAQEVERLGVRTFSREEMAANILALCTFSVAQFCQDQPILVDLNGGLDKVKHLGKEIKSARGRIQDSKTQVWAVSDELKIDEKSVHGSQTLQPSKEPTATTIPTMELSTLPDLDYHAHIEPLAANLRGMIDLDHTMVITGFAELGPFGSARTRMQMELRNGFSDDGCIELAWIMGMIKRSTKAEEADFWVDNETGEVVWESDIKKHYEERILQNTGIRFVDSEGQRQQMLQEIILEGDLAPFTTASQEAVEYAQIHGQNAEIWKDKNSDDWHVLLKAGATMMVPKSRSQPETAVGQLPTGWTPERYGIEQSIINQVDKVTLYTLVVAVEALLASGIPDFYDLYRHVHPSEVANCIGSGQGGMSSLRSLFRDRYTDQTVQNDILQETFANTTGAWVNMLLLGASGPIRTPVGACATALESLDSANELINSGKAKIALVGGVDDWSQEVGNEFGNMKATADSAAQQRAGRAANEFSRPMATSRAGFVEAQGAGIQVVASARLALDLGLPIHGIVAFTGLASDRPGRSVPAPGKGLLNFAATSETSQFPSPMLDLSYRRRVLEGRLAQIEQTRLAELNELNSSTDTAYVLSRQQEINLEAKAATTSIRRSICKDFHQSDPRISLLAGALSTFGLDGNSISILCMHGTSTSKGDTNEALVLNTQLTHLGRLASTPPALAVCSKWLTGHAKGAAGSWALNSALQILATSTVPRNGNLDDLSPELAHLQHISFLGGKGPGLRLATQTPIDAISVSAFGFGQKGAQALIVHPRFLFAALEGGREEFEDYRQRARKRRRVARRELQDGIWSGDLVGKRVRKVGVWEMDGANGGGKEIDEVAVLLDKGWRAA